MKMCYHVLSSLLMNIVLTGYTFTMIVLLNLLIIRIVTIIII